MSKSKPLKKPLSHSIKSLLLLSAAFFLSACGDSDVNVNTTFSNSQAVEEGAEVYFEDQKIGEVSDVDTQGDNQQVELSLNADSAKLISGDAAVVINKVDDVAALKIYNRGADDAPKLEAGQSLKGLDSMFQLGTWMLGDAIKLGTGSVADYVESFQEYLKSDKFQKDKTAVKEQLNSATASAKQAVDQVETEFNQAAKELTDSEGEAAQAIETLGNELAPLVSELSNNGAQLLEQLRQFTQGLERTNTDEKQAGEQLLVSLLATIEKLNHSIDEGSQQKDPEIDQDESAKAEQ